MQAPKGAPTGPYRSVKFVLAMCRFFLSLGIHEDNGNNRTIIGVLFGWNGVAWCAETVYVIFTLCGFVVPKSASAHGLTDLMRSAGWKSVPVDQAGPGDVIDYAGFSHTGICEGRINKNTVSVFEGNHNNRFMRVPRSLSSIARVTRPPYVKAAPVPAPVTPPTKLPANPEYHKAYRVHKPGPFTNETGHTSRVHVPTDAPAVTGTVYPAPELGDSFKDADGDLMVPIKWGGHNSEGKPNEGWYRYDYLRWI